MVLDRIEANGERVRAALDAAARDARAIVADADRKGDALIESTLAAAAEDRRARRIALQESRGEIARASAEAESELKRLAAMLRESAPYGDRKGST